MALSSDKIPYPVLSVGMDCTVLYSNAAGELLLHEWGTAVGQKLPSHFVDIVKGATSIKAPQKMEVKTGNSIYLVSFHPILEEECVNIYGFDISERKDLEVKLRNSEEKYRNIVETTNDYLVVVDTEFKITYIGKELTDISGYSQEEVIGRSWLDFVSEEGKSVAKMQMGLRRQGVDDRYELKFICKNGSSFWALLSAKSLFDKDGNFTGCLAMLTDITHRKKAEIALRRNEQRLNDLLNSIHDGFFELDHEWRFTYINRIASQNVGFKPEELIGECVWDKAPLAVKKRYETMFREIMETHIPTSFEVKNWISDYWYEINVYPSVSGISVLWQDITYRKKVEEALGESKGRLQALFNLLPVGVSITDKERNILDANRALESILGISRTDLLKGMQKTRKYLRSDGTEMTVEEFPDVRALKEEGSIQISEMGIIKEDGSTIWTDVSAIALPFSDEQLIITTTDITERKKTHDILEEKVKERTVELEKAYKWLKQSESGLAEAQRIAHIGNWEWDVANDIAHWSEEMYRIFGLNPQERAPSFNEFLNYIHPDDRDCINRIINKRSEVFLMVLIIELSWIMEKNVPSIHKPRLF